MSDEAKRDQGWALPSSSRKFHYFRGDGRSVCGKWWAIWMGPHEFEPETEKRSPDECAGCRRKLDKQGTVPAHPAPIGGAS